MDDFIIETPEQVMLSYTVAGLGTRFMALAIDTLIQIALLLALILPMQAIDGWRESLAEWYVGIMITAISVVIFGYSLFFELIMKGRTPGKAAMKLRVIRQDGRAADVSGIVLRNLIRIIDFLPSLYVVGVIVIFVNKSSRRLGDIAAGTVVIVEGKRARLETALAEQKGEVAGDLSDREYALLRDFMVRRKTLSHTAREQLARDLAEPLYTRMDIPEHQRYDSEEFLEGLLRPRQEP